MREELVERFATRDGNGQRVGICVYQQIINAASFGDPHATVRGLKRLETDNGDAVNFIDDETYQIVVTGETLTRIA